MGWKSIQMQVALTRTVDIGKAQALEQRQAQTSQELTANLQQKQEEIKRRKPNESEQIADLSNKDSHDKPSEDDTEHRPKKKDKQKNINSHPYLGNEIDLSK